MNRNVGRESGIAMVTVLFVGAALTALASVAAFTTVREFRSGTDDRRSGRALAYAEAGVDRMIAYLQSGEIHWDHISLAGCTAATSPDGTDHPALAIPGGGQAQIGQGSYTTRLEVFNPFAADPAKRFAPEACKASASPLNYARYYKSPKTPTGAPQYFAIISTGAAASSAGPCAAGAGGGCRVVRQVLAVRNAGLPVGIYAKDSIDANGAPTVSDLSIITEGPVTGREKIGFKGTDRYYTLADFGWGTMTNASTTFAPAAIHSTKSISQKTAVGGLNSYEHPSSGQAPGVPKSMNCDANDFRGTAGQSQWDQSGEGFGGENPSGTAKCALWGGTPSAPPPRSTLKDVSTLISQRDLTPETYAALKQNAQTQGLFCDIVSATNYTCTRKGAPWGFNPAAGTVKDSDMTALPALPNVVVAYFDYDPAASLKSINWSAAWGPCNVDPALNKTVILIVRNGDLLLTGGTAIHGAIIAANGKVSETGGASVDGSIIARAIDINGPTGAFQLSECALQSLPSLFLDFTPFSWTEVDR